MRLPSRGAAGMAARRAVVQPTGGGRLPAVDNWERCVLKAKVTLEEFIADVRAEYATLLGEHTFTLRYSDDGVATYYPLRTQASYTSALDWLDEEQQGAVRFAAPRKPPRPARGERAKHPATAPPSARPPRRRARGAAAAGEQFEQFTAALAARFEDLHTRREARLAERMRSMAEEGEEDEASSEGGADADAADAGADADDDYDT